MIKEDSKKKPSDWVQDEVKFLSQTIKTNLELNRKYHMIFFDEFRLFAFFKSDPFKLNSKTEIPVFVLKIKDILLLNFRVPERIMGKFN